MHCNGVTGMKLHSVYRLFNFGSFLVSIPTPGQFIHLHMVAAWGLCLEKDNIGRSTNIKI